ncbi:Protein of unknown function [Meinhardsimonia xiamenensis]|jgi:hypothetical protein|uniref:DUF3168 domain-containing protein n=1 Tax=Meinhardsimonia xiamenensis TaxID=990712 RepID=A0A1G9AGG8_9RHOB|nr:DUF3168 domain-containing protein [Meinhardsimonia xiamenensis]PRX35390.1 uncharacterized protein DUF3168 [Meinhardsimonia xiamenensis]SDK26447.1 Protein of unknown function [Meinhardsimonia xiamenensis]
MSYGTSAALQEAVFARLQGDAALVALVGSAIYDEVPPGALPPTYVSIGPEEARDASDGSVRGARHDFTVSVISDAAGFQTAKEVAVAVSDALLGAPLALSRGRVVGLWFLSAKAARDEAGVLRRIDLRFRARTEDI